MACETNVALKGDAGLFTCNDGTAAKNYFLLPLNIYYLQHEDVGRYLSLESLLLLSSKRFRSSFIICDFDADRAQLYILHSGSMRRPV